MQTDPLSEADALKLFNSVSKNLDDPDKLNELLGNTEPAKEEPAPVEEVKEEEVVLVQEEEKKEEQAPQEDAPKAEAPATEQAPVADQSSMPTTGELERLIQENKLLQHKHRSESNRTAALQRKLNELEARLASLSTPTAKPPADKAAPATEEGEDEDLKDLQRTDPALYRIIKKREEAQRAEVERLKNTLTQELAPVRQAALDQETNFEKARLKELVPNVAEVVQSEAFKAFVEVASPGVKSLVMSRSADDVVAGLQVYSQWLQQNGLVSRPSATESAPVTTAPAAPTALSQERERKLQQAVTVKSPAAPVKKELTPEELFAQSYQQFHKLHGTT